MGTNQIGGRREHAVKLLRTEFTLFLYYVFIAGV